MEQSTRIRNNITTNYTLILNHVLQFGYFKLVGNISVQKVNSVCWPVFARLFNYKITNLNCCPTQLLSMIRILLPTSPQHENYLDYFFYLYSQVPLHMKKRQFSLSIITKRSTFWPFILNILQFNAGIDLKFIVNV